MYKIMSSFLCVFAIKVCITATGFPLQQEPRMEMSHTGDKDRFPTGLHFVWPSGFSLPGSLAGLYRRLLVV